MWKVLYMNVDKSVHFIAKKIILARSKKVHLFKKVKINY